MSSLETTFPGARADCAVDDQSHIWVVSESGHATVEVRRDGIVVATLPGAVWDGDGGTYALQPRCAAVPGGGLLYVYQCGGFARLGRMSLSGTILWDRSYSFLFRLSAVRVVAGHGVFATTYDPGTSFVEHFDLVTGTSISAETAAAASNGVAYINADGTVVLEALSHGLPGLGIGDPVPTPASTAIIGGAGPPDQVILFFAKPGGGWDTSQAVVVFAGTAYESRAVEHPSGGYVACARGMSGVRVARITAPYEPIAWPPVPVVQPVSVAPMPRPLWVGCFGAAGNPSLGLDAALFMAAPGNCGLTGVGAGALTTGASLLDLAALKPIVISASAADLDAATGCWSRVLALYVSDDTDSLEACEAKAVAARQALAARGLTPKPLIVGANPNRVISAGRGPKGIDLVGLEAGYNAIDWSPERVQATWRQAAALLPPTQALAVISRAYLWFDPPVETDVMVASWQSAIFDLARTDARVVAIFPFCWDRGLHRGMRDLPAVLAWYRALVAALPAGVPTLPVSPLGGSVHSAGVSMLDTFPRALSPGSGPVTWRDPNNGVRLTLEVEAGAAPLVPGDLLTVQIQLQPTGDSATADLHVGMGTHLGALPVGSGGLDDRTGKTRLVRLSGSPL